MPLARCATDRPIIVRDEREAVASAGTPTGTAAPPGTITPSEVNR